MSCRRRLRMRWRHFLAKNMQIAPGMPSAVHPASTPEAALQPLALHRCKARYNSRECS